MANPLVPQGVLNRIKASIVFANFPNLNITAPYLGRNGVSMRPEGPVTNYLPTMTGAARSPEVYQKMTISAALIKPQQLADLFKRQMELDAALGDFVVRPDVSTGLSPYQISNGSIENVGDLAFNGSDESYPVMLGGFWQVNSALFD